MLDPESKFWFGLAIIIYLAGLVGALLFFSGIKLGYTLSILHQLVLIPVIVISTQVYTMQNDETATTQWQGFTYALEDAASLAVVSYNGVTTNRVHTPSEVSVRQSRQVGVTLLFTFGSQTILSQLQPRTGYNYYGANILALLSVFILLAARRRLGQETKPGAS